MTDDILEHFERFMEKPSLGTFEAARSALIGSPAYQPYSQDLYQAEKLFEERRYQEVLQAIAGTRPNLLLSPRAHLLVGMACKELGKPEDSQAEMMFMQLCLHGIKLTGDGSADRPFKVTRVSDEYDVLMSLGKKLEMQALSKAGGRACDAMTLEGGGTLFFDINDCISRLRDGDLPDRRPPAGNKKWWQFWRS